MSLKTAAKYIIQKGLTPFLSDTKQQHRVIILHEIKEQYQKNFYEFLNLVNSFPVSMDITITFDDGFHSSYEVIKRVSPQKAIFFVCPEYVNRVYDTAAWQEFFHNNLSRGEQLDDHELLNAVRPVSWEELGELARLGYRIGSHTMNHARLSKIISQKELEREIIGSAEMIEDKLQIKVDSLAYPFGDSGSINERALTIIKKRYKRCFTGVRGNNVRTADALLVWRDAMDLFCPKDYREFLLRGGFDWYYWGKRKRIQMMERHASY